MSARSTWVPRSGFDEVGGLVWLPRMLDKVRRMDEGLGNYVALASSPVDVAALRSWHLRPEHLEAWVRDGLDDEAIAARVAEAAGLDAQGCRRWSSAFNRRWAPVFWVLDADDGRRPPGLASSLLKGFVPVFMLYRRVFGYARYDRPVP